MPNSSRSVRILLTTAEAFPALERAFLAAKAEIWASFMVFDLTTRLQSSEALAIGKTWFDLIVHTLNRGVALNICIADLDPIISAEGHRTAYRHLRLFSAAAAVANPGARLKIDCARHPAQGGLIYRLAMWPRLMRHLWRATRAINDMTAEVRAAVLRDLGPGPHPFPVRTDGTVGRGLMSFPPIYTALHHQKMAVIDRTQLFIGGLDLSEHRIGPRAGGKVRQHTWHDVQLMIEGPVVGEAQLHLETFRDVIDGKLQQPRTRRLLRTLSRPRRRNLWYWGPEPIVGELRSAHLVMARRTRSFIYMESQYFRDEELALLLAENARRNPDLRMIVVLPAAPDEVEGQSGLGSRGYAIQDRCLRILQHGFGDRLFVGAPAQIPPDDAPTRAGDRQESAANAALVYIHAKVSVFDDTSAIVSSANLNSRSLRWDTEAGIYLTSRNDALELRHRVMAHWLPPEPGADAFEPDTVVAAWRRIAWRNAALTGADRIGCILPYDFALAEVHGKKLPAPPAGIR